MGETITAGSLMALAESVRPADPQHECAAMRPETFSALRMAIEAQDAETAKRAGGSLTMMFPAPLGMAIEVHELMGADEILMGTREAVEGEIQTRRILKAAGMDWRQRIGAS